MSHLVIPSTHATGGALAALPAALARTVRNLRERVAARRALVELSRLDDRTLKDIGYRRPDLLAVGFSYGSPAGGRGRVRPVPADAWVGERSGG